MCHMFLFSSPIETSPKHFPLSDGVGMWGMLHTIGTSSPYSCGSKFLGPWQPWHSETSRAQSSSKSSLIGGSEPSSPSNSERSISPFWAFVGLPITEYPRQSIDSIQITVFDRQLNNWMRGPTFQDLQVKLHKMEVDTSKVELFVCTHTILSNT